MYDRTKKSTQVLNDYYVSQLLLPQCTTTNGLTLHTRSYAQVTTIVWKRLIIDDIMMVSHTLSMEPYMVGSNTKWGTHTQSIIDISNVDKSIYSEPKG